MTSGSRGVALHLAPPRDEPGLSFSGMTGRQADECRFNNYAARHTNKLLVGRASPNVAQRRNGGQ